jgi:hypothetical protein
MVRYISEQRAGEGLTHDGRPQEQKISAQECSSFLSRQPHAAEEHMWRDISESWLGMIGFAEQEDFAAEEHERGTNQQRSKSSH